MRKPQQDLTAKQVKDAIRSQYITNQDKCKPKKMDKTPFMLYGFKGYGTHPSVCGVDFLDTKDGKIVVLLTDIGIGTSVTNAAEQLAGELYRTYLYKSNPNEIIWIEHYPYTDYYDRIIFDQKWDHHFYNPTWERINLCDLQLV